MLSDVFRLSLTPILNLVLSDQLILLFYDFQFWIFLWFSTAPACRKKQKIFDILTSTIPNYWAAEDNYQKFINVIYGRPHMKKGVANDTLTWDIIKLNWWPWLEKLQGLKIEGILHQFLMKSGEFKFFFATHPSQNKCNQNISEVVI